MKRWFPFGVVLFGIFGLILIFPSACGSMGASQNGTHEDRITHTLIVEPDDGRTPLLEAINYTDKLIYLTIYALDDATIEAALKAAQKRGVTVEVLYNYYSFSGTERDYVRETMASLEAADILTKPATSEFYVTHQKTFTLVNTNESQKSIVMTFNLQPNYFGGTRDFGIITTDSREVSEIIKVFEADWNYTKVSPEVDSLVWSNNNSRTKILELIKRATHSIELYNEELKDSECLNALTAEAAAGVTVRVICASLEGKEGDENRPARKLLNSYGAKAKYMPSSYLYCHAKMILVDYNTSSAEAFIGSENLSSTSLDENRELGIIVKDPEILERLHKVFEIDWPHCAFDS